MKSFQPLAAVTYGGERMAVSLGKTVLPQGLTVAFSEETAENAVLLRLSLSADDVAPTAQIVDPCTLEVIVPTGESVFYHTLHGDSCGAESFLPKAFSLTEAYREEPRGGRSSDTTGFPFFDLDDGDGALAFGIGWTGQWYRELTPVDGGLLLRIGLAEADFYLKPGETVELPSVLVVTGTDGADARRNLRRCLHDHFSPRVNHPRFSMPVSIQCFDRYFQKLDGSDGSMHWASEEGQMEMVRAAKKIGGIDTLWIDAAWFAEGFPNGVGNYRFAEGFPNGLKAVSDYAHENGMRFVLWFEPERIHEGSDLFPETEKLLSRERWGLENRLYRLGDSKAYAWLEETLLRIIDENGIDVYRQDCNVDPLPYWRDNDETDRKGLCEVFYVNGLYRLWDAIQANNPDLMIDNCCGGGRRLDLNLMMRAVSLWRSDTGCFPETAERRVNEWSTNQILTLSEYLPFHSCATWSYEAYAVRSVATQGLACNFDVLNPDFDYAAANRALDEVSRLKHFWDGDFYPLTVPTTQEDVWCAYQLALPESGVLYAFRRKDSAEAKQTFALATIDRTAQYRLTLTDESYVKTECCVSGAELADGFTVEIPNARASLILEYCKA